MARPVVRLDFPRDPSRLALAWLAFAALGGGARAQETRGNAASSQAPAASDARALVEPARAFFQENCVRCHGPAKAKAGLRLDALEWDATREETLETWQAVLDRLAADEMPPEEEPRPDPLAVRDLCAAIQRAITAVGEGPGAPRVLRRLNQAQYRNTLRDLLHIDVLQEDPTASFPPDDTLEGFDDLGEGLVMSDFLLRQVLTAARRALDLATFSGPQPEPTSYRMFDPEPKRARGFEINHIRSDHGPTFLFLNDERAPGDTRGQNLTTSREGAVAPGWYDFRFEVESRGRANPPAGLLREVRAEWQKIHPEDLQRLEIYLTAPVGTSSVTGRRRILMEALDLPDDERVTLERRYWLARGWRVELAFGNAYAGHLADYLAALGAKDEVEALAKLPKLEQFDRMADLTYEWIERADAPRIVIHAVTESGPSYESWPPPSQLAAWGDPALPLEERLRAFATRAFRRPVALEELDPYLRLARTSPEGQRTAVEAILCSPRFLYLAEDDGPLDDWALAARLSYFLWSTMPDDALLARAAEGRLHEPAVLRAEAQRLLADPRSSEFVEHFTWGWLNLQNALDMAPDPMRFPEYHRGRLGPAMVAETRLFFRHLLDEDRPLLEFIDSDTSFVNADLARLYGIEGVPTSAAFQRVTLPAELGRGGLLGQGAVLTTSANGVDTSPVVRGVWILDHLLGTPPDPPPPGVVLPEPDARGELTIRQRFEKHRTSESCNDCHRTIDPLGFALEGFDAIGRRRTTYESGTPIDTSGRMPGGEPFTDVQGMKQAVREELPLFTRNLARRLATYAAGRTLRAADRPELDRLASEAVREGRGLRDLVLAVIESRIFRER